MQQQKWYDINIAQCIHFIRWHTVGKGRGRCARGCDDTHVSSSFDMRMIGYDDDSGSAIHEYVFMNSGSIINSDIFWEKKKA